MPITVDSWTLLLVTLARLARTLPLDKTSLSP